MFEHDQACSVLALRCFHARFERLEDGVGNFPEDIDLQLLCGRIADAYGRGVLIASEPGDDQFRQPVLSADAIHDLHLMRGAGDGANEPVSPYLGFVVVSQMHEGEERKGGVTQPAKAVIPVPYATQTRGKGGRDGRNDPARWRIGQSLQRDQRTLNSARPRSDVGTTTSPLTPKLCRSFQHRKWIDRRGWALK